MRNPPPADSKVKRMELGRVSFKERDIADLLTLYGVSDQDDREATLALARRSDIPGWWQRFTDPMPATLESYHALERMASIIRICETQYVPALLQTPDYARAAINAARPWMPAGEVDRQVERGMRRQRLL